MLVTAVHTWRLISEFISRCLRIPIRHKASEDYWRASIVIACVIGDITGSAKYGSLGWALDTGKMAMKVGFGKAGCLDE